MLAAHQAVPLAVVSVDLKLHPREVPGIKPHGVFVRDAVAVFGAENGEEQQVRTAVADHARTAPAIAPPVSCATTRRLSGWLVFGYVVAR